MNDAELRNEVESLRNEIHRRDRWSSVFMTMFVFAWYGQGFFGPRAGWVGAVLGAVVGWLLKRSR